MQVAAKISAPAPTISGVEFRPANFANFAEALSYAATGATGFTYYNSRGEVSEVLTYRRLQEEAAETATRLLALGLTRGDRVAILAETEADFARAFSGAMLAGLVPAPLPLPVAFSAREAYNDQLRRIVAVAGARAVITPAEYENWVAEAMRDVGLLFCGRLGDLPTAEGAPPPHPTLRPDDLAYLQFSSGTTGSPKGVAVTHRSMMANLNAIAEHGLKLRAGDRGVSWLPLYHDMGLVGCFLTPIATQFSADYIATKDFIRRPLLWLELIDRNRATVTFGPTLGYDLAHRRARGRAPEGLDLSSWRVAGIGADMVKAPVIRAFAETFAAAGFDPDAFTPSYGMAETTLALSFAPLGQGLRTARLDLDALERQLIAKPAVAGGKARDFALCGPPLPDHAMEIRDETGKRLPDGRVGRIFAAGPSLMREYFGDPAQTAACLSDGWLDTGDLGYLTTGEHAGQIVITGRAKDLMIVNGRNIWPQDLEWTVETRVEHAREGGVAAFSTTVDDSGPKIEEEIVVVVECRLRDPAGRESLRAEIHGAVRESHGVDARIAFAKNGELPSTSSGKLSRAKARLMYLDGLFDLPASSPPQTPPA
ncbi:fatty acyl-AMP ligase [Pikeienuella piscinae]|uniref:Fatty acyl-AMP ligase n=1 Tax=Pikeienuella piscinae TaxID=2748098 RepID=A0A7M3T5M7_9RHOB|nr:fatty acyl-AMP ligase [Pikeienuella piscinae]QIE57308.1 fatty acyl-AMP ligase [Pikeienuella piscinae]